MYHSLSLARSLSLSLHLSLPLSARYMCFRPPKRSASSPPLGGTKRDGAQSTRYKRPPATRLNNNSSRGSTEETPVTAALMFVFETKYIFGPRCKDHRLESVARETGPFIMSKATCASSSSSPEPPVTFMFETMFHA